MDKEEKFLVDLQRINPSAAALYLDHKLPRMKEETVFTALNRIYAFAHVITTSQQAKDIIPLIAQHFGPENVHREYFKNLKGGHKFYAKFNSSNFPRWDEYWAYELAQREKIDKAFTCKMHDIFAFRSDIHPMEYIPYLRAFITSCSAFGFIIDSGLILCFDNEEDEILARINFSDMVA